MNTELLLKISDRIIKHPDHFDMSCFFGVRSSQVGKPYILRVHPTELELQTNCNTVACIAGQAILLTQRLAEVGKGDGKKSEFGLACEILGLSQEKATALFHLEYWPEPFGANYYRAMDNRNDIAAAQVVAKRIHHFIKTEGRE